MSIDKLIEVLKEYREVLDGDTDVCFWDDEAHITDIHGVTVEMRLEGLNELVIY